MARLAERPAPALASRRLDRDEASTVPTGFILRPSARRRCQRHHASAANVSIRPRYVSGPRAPAPGLAGDGRLTTSLAPQQEAVMPRPETLLALTPWQSVLRSLVKTFSTWSRVAASPPSAGPACGRPQAAVLAGPPRSEGAQAQGNVRASCARRDRRQVHDQRRATPPARAHQPHRLAASLRPPSRARPDASCAGWRRAR
jgi:hypothetical protein